MKNFIKEFKEFALKGNVMDLAIGVIIGGAFTAIVTAFTEDFINPLLNMIGGAEFGGRIPLPFGPAGNALLWGDFLSSVVNFLIVAFILFLMVKGLNKLMSIGKKEEEAIATTKKCPFCKTDINIKATRCPHCTSEVPLEDEEA
ncbi:large conductance mechanosensitive channel protein MscL [Eubacterium xylanophilum]|uniref:large conductance mechanosensitive channel protein MscL n=1 Tax=Eubacterium xylanophilum TaxID=39497 RepID=UPI0004B6A8F1|nr:large conductance mechanosensitive channel protein MscL [Eubacterium xylanophilum]